MEYGLSGAAFKGFRSELLVWLIAIYPMANAKDSLSSHQLSRDLEGNQQAAWHMQQRIRSARASEPLPMPPGIVEADGTPSGGRNVKSTKRMTYPPPPEKYARPGNP